MTKAKKTAAQKPAGQNICVQCFSDASLPPRCQFDLPRGLDVRKDRSGYYCGTCGSERHIAKRIGPVQSSHRKG